MCTQCLETVEDGESWTRSRNPEPSFSQLEQMIFNGVAEATDGCVVEPDGTCPHGCNSWLIELGYI